MVGTTRVWYTLAVLGGFLWVVSSLVTAGIALQPVPTDPDPQNSQNAINERARLLGVVGLLAWIGLVIFVIGTLATIAGLRARVPVARWLRETSLAFPEQRMPPPQTASAAGAGQIVGEAKAPTQCPHCGGSDLSGAADGSAYCRTCHRGIRGPAG